MSTSSRVKRENTHRCSRNIQCAMPGDRSASVRLSALYPMTRAIAPRSVTKQCALPSYPVTSATQCIPAIRTFPFERPAGCSALGPLPAAATLPPPCHPTEENDLQNPTCAQHAPEAPLLGPPAYQPLCLLCSIAVSSAASSSNISSEPPLLPLPPLPLSPLPPPCCCHFST